VAKTRSYSSSGSSQSGMIRCEKPALLTRMSSPPKPDTASSIIACTSAERETSARKKRAVPPSLAIAEATRRPFSSFTSATTTRAPSRAKRVAMASPNPDPAPVTIAILPSNLMPSLLSGAGRPGSTAPRRARARRLGSGVRGGGGAMCIDDQQIYRQSAGSVSTRPRASGTLVLPLRPARHGEDDLAPHGTAGRALGRSPARARVGAPHPRSGTVQRGGRSASPGPVDRGRRGPAPAGTSRPGSAPARPAPPALALRAHRVERPSAQAGPGEPPRGPRHQSPLLPPHRLRARRRLRRGAGPGLRHTPRRAGREGERRGTRRHSGGVRGELPHAGDPVRGARQATRRFHPLPRARGPRERAGDERLRHLA